jgi:hypothetical protein
MLTRRHWQEHPWTWRQTNILGGAGVSTEKKGKERRKERNKKDQSELKRLSITRAHSFSHWRPFRLSGTENDSCCLNMFPWVWATTSSTPSPLLVVLVVSVVALVVMVVVVVQVVVVIMVVLVVMVVVLPSSSYLFECAALLGALAKATLWCWEASGDKPNQNGKGTRHFLTTLLCGAADPALTARPTWVRMLAITVSTS